MKIAALSLTASENRVTQEITFIHRKHHTILFRREATRIATENHVIQEETLTRRKLQGGTMYIMSTQGVLKMNIAQVIREQGTIIQLQMSGTGIQEIIQP